MYLDVKATGEGVLKSITVFIGIDKSYTGMYCSQNNTVNLKVSENAPPGTFVGIIKNKEVINRNERINFTFHGHPYGISINSTTGAVTTTAPFDYEKENLYYFKAFLHGTQSTTIECNIYLYVIDVNDNAPQFTASEYEVKVQEDAPLGYIILRLQVNDFDTVNKFIYEISVIGNEKNWFGIKPDGRIFLVAPLDYEENTFHQLTITICDQKLPEKSFQTTTKVTVSVVDVNDNAPQIISPPVFVVLQNIAPDTIIGRIKAKDPDKGYNSQLQYRILPWSHPEGLFTIDSIHGYLKVREQICDETTENYHFLVEIADFGISRRLSTVIEVTVITLSSNKGSLKSKRYHHVTVPENAATFARNAKFEIEDGNEDGYFYVSPTNGTVTVNQPLNSPKKSNYNLTVSLLSTRNSKKKISIIIIDILTINDEKIRFFGGNQKVFYVGENIEGPYPITGNSTLFRLTAQTGELQIRETLDREFQEQYELVVQVNDLSAPRRPGTTSTITVIVLDENDNAPVFEQQEYYLEVVENKPVKEDSILICLQARDRDHSQFSMIRYYIEDVDLVPFSINSTTGCVSRLKILDREAQSNWILKIRAEDNGEYIKLSSTAILRIRVLDENDNPPLILNEHLDIFISDAIKTDEVVYILSASDLDEGDMLYYSIAGRDASNFHINQNGVITAVKELMVQDYSITASVSDPGNLNASVGLEFYTAKAIKFPIFKKISQHVFNITEHAEDVLITRFSVYTANVSSRGILFSIVSGDPRHHFNLNSQTGELFSTSRIDYEYRKQYNLWIAAIDQHTQPMVSYANCIVNIIDINDNKPKFEKIFYSASVKENGEENELVTKVTAHDSDYGMNGKIRYSMLVDSSDSWKFFRINEESGEIFTVSSLDAENSREHFVYITAADHGTPELSETITVKIDILDENDNSPRFSNLFHASVLENAAVRTPVLQVTSYDSDVNSTLIYGLEGIDADNFLIDRHTGLIVLAKELDREERNEYSVKVKAWDGLWEVRTSLIIIIQDVNDNAPIFSQLVYAFPVLSNSKIFTKIGEIMAQDVDFGLNGKLYYDLICHNEAFMIVPFTGYILSISNLQEYVNTTIKCLAFATDYGIPSLTSEATVYIYITDPSYHNSIMKTYEFAMLPATESNSVIGHLPFLADSQDNVMVNDSRFMVSQDGYLITKTAFSDDLSIQKIGFLITTSDFVFATVIVEITEPNMHRPQFSLNRYEFSVHENCDLQTSVGSIFAEDSDDGLNGRIIYYIQHDYGFLPFSVHAITGTIFTTGQLDFEEIRYYQFLVVAVDSGFVPLNSTAEVVLEIIDENDNLPEFENYLEQYTISEDSPVGTEITCFNVNDIDSKSNAFVYRIIPDSTVQIPFAINATDGTLYVSSVLHYETATEYMLRVQVSDSEIWDVPKQTNLQHKIYNNILHIEITVEPSFHEVAAYFVHPQRSFEISASARKDTIIGRIDAFTLNGNYPNQIYYRIVSNDLVKINDRTGEICVKKNWNETGRLITVQVAVTSQLSRNSTIIPNIGKFMTKATNYSCKVYIAMKETEAFPLLQPYYNFSLLETDNDDDSNEIIVLHRLPQDSRLEIINDGLSDIGQLPFCNNGSGSIKLCRQINYKQPTIYHLKIAIIQHDIVRSRASLTITVSNNATIAEQITLVGYTPENSPPGTPIIKLPLFDMEMISGKQLPFRYKIVDNDLSQVFAINETTGVLSNIKILDRENRPLYILHVTVSSIHAYERFTSYQIRVHVDDQDDNLPEELLRTIDLRFVADQIAETGITVHITPVDMDHVGMYECYSADATQLNHVFGKNCSLKLDGDSLNLDHFRDNSIFVTASSHNTNVTFPIKLRMERDTLQKSFFEESAIVIELWSDERCIADSLATFEELYQNLTLQLFGIEQFSELDFFRMFVAVLDENSAPLSKIKSSQILEDFFTSKSIFIHLKQIAENVCSTSDKCIHGSQYSRNVKITNEVMELVGYKTTFVVPLVKRRAEDQTRCAESTGCQNGGTCMLYSDTCHCRKGYIGKFCENDIDECEIPNICGNAKCLNLPGSFVCSCESSNTVRAPLQCSSSYDNDICNKCHRGKCFKEDDDKYSCKCDQGYTGRYCQLKSRCFDGPSSLINFTFENAIFKFTLGFKTSSQSGLLVMIYGSSKFTLTLALQNGHIRLLSSTEGKKMELLINEEVGDGKWKLIRFQYKHQTLKLTLENCDEDGFCRPCNNSRCFTATKDFKILILLRPSDTFETSYKLPNDPTGGLKKIRLFVCEQSFAKNAIADFEGCMRQLVMNDYNIENIINSPEQEIEKEDELKTCANDNDDAETTDICLGGICVNDDNHYRCICKDGYDAVNCHKAIEPWYFNNGGVVFRLSAFIIHQIKFTTLNASIKISSRRHERSLTDHNKETLREIPCEESEIEGDIIDDISAQWMELDFRTALENTIILMIIEERKYSKIELINGSAYLIAKLQGAKPVQVHIESDLNDMKWHRLSLQISEDQRLLRVEASCSQNLIQIDGHGKEIKSEEQLPTLISVSLKFVSLGEDPMENRSAAFSGCFRRLIVNNQAQSFDSLERNLLSQQIYRSIRHNGVQKGCDHLSTIRVNIALLKREAFWILMLILFILFLFLTLIVLFWFLRRQPSSRNKQKGRKKWWKTKFLKLLFVLTSNSDNSEEVSNGDSNRIAPQQAIYFSSSATLNNNEVDYSEQLLNYLLP
ncbi:unnamed protein product [Thelazia callipaeda]|uniref:Cadherin n=1 Tax=Thelazia callipaeda TaxID=103827 RepID=A0A158RCG5_THECL|nr:unnamed protein product [Thelazia callipaeda]